MNLISFYFYFNDILFRMDFFFISLLMFYGGLCGILIAKESLILILISLELIFISIILNLILFSNWFNDLFGYFFTIVLLTVIAVESSVDSSAVENHFSLVGKAVRIDFALESQGNCSS